MEANPKTQESATQEREGTRENAQQNDGDMVACPMRDVMEKNC